MMQLLLVSPYFPPQQAVASHRAHSFASHWAEAGVDVTVLTTAKRADQQGLDLPREGFDVVEVPYQGPHYLEWLRRRHKAANIEPVKNALPKAGRKPAGLLGRLRDSRGVFCSVRMPDLTDHWVRPAIDWAKQNGPWDVVVSSSGPYTAHLVAMVVKSKGIAPRWVADFRDLWVDNHMYRGVFPFTVRERVLEKCVLREADLLTTVSEGLGRKLRRKCDTPIVTVYNGCDENALSRIPADPIFPDDGMVRLVYTGALYVPGQDPSPLLQAVAILKEEHPDIARRICLEVCGYDCNSWRSQVELFEVEELLNVRGMVSHADSLRMQRDADALITVEWAQPEEGVLTGKLFEYLFASPPIIMIGPTDGSPIADLIARTGRGLCPGEDPARVASVLKDLAERAGSIGLHRDDEQIGAYTRRNQSLALLEQIEEIVSDGKAFPHAGE